MMGFGKRRKFNTAKERPVGITGRSYHSKLERDYRDKVLAAMEAAGEIRDIKDQPQVYLTDARIGYRPDFMFYAQKQIQWGPDTVIQPGEQVWIETKGFETADWLIKKKLWSVYGPGKLIIIGGRAGVRGFFKTKEVLSPREARVLL